MLRVVCKLELQKKETKCKNDGGQFGLKRYSNLMGKPELHSQHWENPPLKIILFKACQ